MSKTETERRPTMVVPAVVHAPVVETDPEYPTVHWVACSGCSYVQGPCETTEHGDAAWADHLVDLPTSAAPAPAPVRYEKVEGTAWNVTSGRAVLILSDEMTPRHEPLFRAVPSAPAVDEGGAL